MKDQDLARTRKILELWGNWSHNDTGVSWYREMPGLKNVMPRQFEYKERLSDNDALVIDKMVACMYDQDNERPISIFILHYVYGVSKSEISRQITRQDRSKCSEGKIRSTLLLMESMVCGMLLAREEMGFKLEFGG